MIKYFTLPALLLLYHTNCQPSAYPEKLRGMIKASQPKNQSLSRPIELKRLVESTRNNPTQKPDASNLTSITESYSPEKPRGTIKASQPENQSLSRATELRHLVESTRNNPTQEPDASSLTSIAESYSPEKPRDTIKASQPENQSLSRATELRHLVESIGSNFTQESETSSQTSPYPISPLSDFSAPISPLSDSSVPASPTSIINRASKAKRELAEQQKKSTETAQQRQFTSQDQNMSNDLRPKLTPTDQKDDLNPSKQGGRVNSIRFIPELSNTIELSASATTEEQANAKRIRADKRQAEIREHLEKLRRERQAEELHAELLKKVLIDFEIPATDAERTKVLSDVIRFVNGEKLATFKNEDQATTAIRKTIAEDDQKLAKIILNHIRNTSHR